MTSNHTAAGQSVVTALAEQTGFKSDELMPCMSLRTDCCMGDIEILEAALAIEFACGVELPDEDLERVHTVGDLIRLVDRVRGAA